MTPFTFCGWFTFSSLGDQCHPISWGPGRFDLLADPTNSPMLLTWCAYDESQNLYSVETFVTLEADTPYFLAVYWDGETMGLSVNAGTWATAPTCATLYEDGDMVFRVAGDPSDAGPVSCSKFKTYPRVLTYAEIASLYQEGA